MATDGGALQGPEPVARGSASGDILRPVIAGIAGRDYPSRAAKSAFNPDLACILETVIRQSFAQLPPRAP
jgi:hypothetical protein